MLKLAPISGYAPGLDAVKFLVEQRDILGFGTESIGTDAGQAFAFEPPFPAHATHSSDSA